MFDISDQPAGTYFIIIQDEFGKLKTSKIMYRLLKIDNN